MFILIKKIIFLFISYDNMRKISLLLLIIMLFSCVYNHNKNPVYIKNINSIDFIIDQFTDNIEKLWGLNETLTLQSRDYIKYSDHYKTRSYINFASGIITIETIAKKNPIKCLRRAIINTILMDSDFNSIDMYSNVAITNLTQKPFLYGQILDNHGKPMCHETCASKFADHLLKHNITTRTSNLLQIWSITMQLVCNNINKRAYKYFDIVNAASQRYGIDQSLILAIIQTESNFNPNAVSNSDALGLMQIIQHSAGRDVFKMQGRWGQPSRNYLFNPENNIDIGTAYLAILQNIYLNGIINPISKRYAVIVAYHSGAGNLLKIFSDNTNTALQIINDMQPSDFYNILYVYHPSIESRRYLYKVNFLQKYYWR